MKHNYEEALQRVKQARAAHRYVQGNLLPPEVMAGLGEQLGPVPAVPGGWLLDGNMHPDMYEVFKRGSFLLFAQSFRAGSSTPYVVLVQQAGHWQHRFVVQLLGADMRAWARSLHTVPLQLQLARGDSEEALVIQGYEDLRDIVASDIPIEAACSDPSAAVLEGLWVASQFSQVDAVTSLYEWPVDDVCVSMVFSEEVESSMTRQGMT